jgi:Mg-chelatase subunit ChlD
MLMVRRCLRRIAARGGLTATVAALAIGALASPALADNAFDPAAVAFSPALPGQSMLVHKTLSLDANPGKADILIAIDTTGSMQPAIDQAKSEATNLVNTVQGMVPDTRFAVVDFRDSGDGAAEYKLRQPMTSTASQVQSAINAMTAGGGGDIPEAYNLVFERATNDGAIGWRSGARQFVVVIGDAPPHGNNTIDYPACGNQSADPHGLVTKTVIDNLELAKRSLLMVAVGGILNCYKQLAADSFTGSTAVQLGSSLTNQIVTAINDAATHIDSVDLSVDPPAFSSWVSFSQSHFGPLTAPTSVTFDETITVPAGTAPGVYQFDVVATADGGERAREHISVTVPAKPAITIDDVTTTEGDTGTTPATFTVTLDNPAVDAVTVDYHTVDGTATAGSDYDATSGTAMIAPGDTSATITVPVRGDTLAELDEGYQVVLDNVTGYATLADDTGDGTIVDDDPVQVSINDNSVREGDTGTRPLPLTVSLDQAPAAPITVNYQVTDQSATRPADYTLADGSLTFTPTGPTSQDVVAQVKGDLLSEGDETFRVDLTLSRTTRAEIADGTGIGTILDDDRDGTFACRARGLKVLGLLGPTPQANPGLVPCKDDSHQVLNIYKLDLLSAVQVVGKVVDTQTDQTPDVLQGTLPSNSDSATARASVTDLTVKIGTLSIVAPEVVATAEAHCDGSTVKTSTGGKLVGLLINGRPATVVGDAPADIPVLIGTLHLNWRGTIGGVTVRRAIWLQSILGDVIVSQAEAGAAGNPCRIGPGAAPAPR